ncbi:MAG: hypothetical protein AMS15_03120 [Planctomycetes bacterium DG_23]|nr:MAG: hypothetical protein AMS15_03120 [Planctomycetes bacterium DG_23]
MIGSLKRWKKKAFTVAELLVVTTIITSAGTGASSYKHAMDKAKQTACLHNLKQVALGLQMYELENGRLPDAKFFPEKPLKDKRSILKFLKGYEQCLICPTMPDEIKKKGLTFIWNDEVSGMSLDQIEDKSKTWLLIEMTAVTPKKVPPPHRGGYNILYADWQVKWTKKLPKLKAIDAEEEGED